jgi:acetyl/propionyl-CoA carboxylase alpha subunit
MTQRMTMEWRGGIYELRWEEKDGSLRAQVFKAGSETALDETQARAEMLDGCVVLHTPGGEKRFPCCADKGGFWLAEGGRGEFFRRTSAGGANAPSKAGGAVFSPMTGKIVSVAVQAGDAVPEGSLLMVLEAMKMEYRLTAPFDATVESVHAEAGALVDMGQVLARLKAKENPS